MVEMNIEMNINLRMVARNDFDKDFSKLMNNAVFWKAMENVTKYKDIKLVTTDKRRNQLVSEPNYHTKKIFSRRFISNRNEKDKSKNE